MAWAKSKTTKHTCGGLRGAKRVLTVAERNHAYAVTACLPAWVRAATAGRVMEARARLAELQRSAAR